MNNEKLAHDLMVDYLKQKLSREYSEIKVNPGGSPDMTLANHGLVLAAMEVETESSITAEKAKEWKSIAQSGVKLILMVPKHARLKVMELLWQSGLASNVGVGTYEITVTMP
ncbi:MAG: hypothetical protein M1510_14780 [Nitrospirae bacterium]|nr:hypothetical protein [Nitrospirota bacterium]